MRSRVTWLASAPSPGTPAFGSEAQARRGEGWGEGLNTLVFPFNQEIARQNPSPCPLPEYRARVRRPPSGLRTHVQSAKPLSRLDQPMIRVLVHQTCL